MVMLRFLSRAPVFLAVPPPPPLLSFALNLPRRLAAVANVLSGMVNTDFLLLQSCLPNPFSRWDPLVLCRTLKSLTRGGVCKMLCTLLKGVRRAHDTVGFYGS
jgi:hypothetical protein